MLVIQKVQLMVFVIQKLVFATVIQISRGISVMNVPKGSTNFLIVKVKDKHLLVYIWSKALIRIFFLFQACTCHLDGTVDGICDPESGSCLCKDEFTGSSCNQCSKGHFQFPLCNRKLHFFEV